MAGSLKGKQLRQQTSPLHEDNTTTSSGKKLKTDCCSAALPNATGMCVIILISSEHHWNLCWMRKPTMGSNVCDWTLMKMRSDISRHQPLQTDFNLSKHFAGNRESTSKKTSSSSNPKFSISWNTKRTRWIQKFRTCYVFGNKSKKDNKFWAPNHVK